MKLALIEILLRLTPKPKKGYSKTITFFYFK